MSPPENRAASAGERRAAGDDDRDGTGFVAGAKLGTAGLAAIFIPWMKISGSVLANYWGKRPVK